MSSGWQLTPASFSRLLDALDPDRERAAHEYEKLRLKIGKLLEWRGCLTPAETADAVIDRLAQRLDRGERVEWIYSYCCGIARMILLEEQRGRDRDAAAREHVSSSAGGHPGAESERGIPLEIFERCLGKLPSDGRDLVLAYYQYEQDAKIDTRKQLADGLGMPLNALRLRVHRLRERLRKCVERHGLGFSDIQ